MTDRFPLTLTPGTHPFRVEAGGRQRTGLIHVPPSRPPAAPVIVMLHGAGGSAPWAEWETGWSDKADRDGFVVVYPDALAPRPDRPSKFLTNPQRWNDGSPHGQPEPAPDDVGFLRELIRQLRVHPEIDDERVFVTGFSNGAGMTFRLGAALSDSVAAIAPVAGHCADPDPRPARPVPTLFVIGSEDPLVPLSGGAARTPWGWVEQKPPVAVTLQRWARGLGCPDAAEVVSETTGLRVADFACGVAFRSVVVLGLGHHWPGGRGGLGEAIGGPILDTLNANDLIWDFFRERSNG